MTIPTPSPTAHAEISGESERKESLARQFCPPILAAVRSARKEQTRPRPPPLAPFRGHFRHPASLGGPSVGGRAVARAVDAARVAGAGAAAAAVDGADAVGAHERHAGQALVGARQLVVLQRLERGWRRRLRRQVRWRAPLRDAGRWVGRRGQRVRERRLRRRGMCRAGAWCAARVGVRRERRWWVWEPR